MLFNSIEFILFFTVVLFFYWKFFNGISIKTRNIFLLVTSYFFYGWWDYRFLGLIFISTITDYTCGLLIPRSKTKLHKHLFLMVSLLVNLGILFFFKYYHFFSKELVSLLSYLGYTASPFTLNIILPVGISFYTFQTLSYTIDIYKGKIQPTKDIIAFFTFVSFFPQLVAGPIERAKHLLPQFFTAKKFDYEKAANGFRYMLWGFFAKIAVADSIAPIVDNIFSHYETMGIGSLIIGAILFTVQIYGDFSGYSNIAIGTAALLGFDLMQNFNTPFFSHNLREFWSRWHISLSTWFRDYVYIPLGGNRCSKLRHFTNIMVTFIVSGLWHGANWTYIVWGTIHGLLYSVTRPFISKSNEKKRTGIFSMAITFIVVCFAFVFFRSSNISQAFVYIDRIFELKNGIDIIPIIGKSNFLAAISFVLILLSVEWVQKEKPFALDIANLKPAIRHGIYYFLIFCILFAFQTDRIFIYFQF